MKKILFILFVALAFNVNAQIVNDWTARLSSEYIPTGATVPTVAALDASKDAQKSKARFEVMVPGSLDNANMVTAFAAIGDAARDSVDSQYVEDIWGLDVTLDITMRTVFTEIKRGYAEFDFGDFANQYKVGTDVFILKGYSEWVIE
jgi:hypothetical protein